MQFNARAIRFISQNKRRLALRILYAIYNYQLFEYIAIARTFIRLIGGTYKSNDCDIEMISPASDFKWYKLLPVKAINLKERLYSAH